MEEFSNGTKRKLYAGLLTNGFCKTLLFFSLVMGFLGQAFCQGIDGRHLTRADAERLEIVPKDDIFFTNKESQFVLKIDGVLPGEVQTELPDFPEGVVFISSRRGEYYSETGISGSQIDLWFTFRQAGNFTLPPLIIYVQGRRFSIKFKTVEVYENPRTILPQLSVVFEGDQTVVEGAKNQSKKGQQKIPSVSFEVSRPIRFTIYLQYAIQVQQFAWNIPKDSLFTEIKRYDITKNVPRSSDFSTEKIPVATFEWTPLLPGVFSLPEVRMMVTAYSGRAVYRAMPECIVTVLEKKNLTKTAAPQNEKKSNSVYAYAFSEPPSAQDENLEKGNSVFDFAQIARLRSMERHAFFSTQKIRESRIAAERSVGVQNSQNERRLFVFIIEASLCGIFVLASILLFAFKKRIQASVVCAVALALVFVSILGANSVFKKYGIVLGGYLCPVPEESALTKTAVTGGSRVLVREEIQDWYFIEYNESGGWIRKENLAVIK